jgi:hypothetical protein
MIVFCQALFGQAADYFVAAELGHDNNSGLSRAEAWQSIERVNQAQLSAGDTVHLKAGSVWRESLMCQSGVEGRPVTYTSYGQGPKPTLLASVDLCSPDAWVPDGRNIWKTRQDRITGEEPIPSFASKDWSLYCDGEGEASMTTRTGHQGSKVYTLRCRNRGERPTNIQLNCVGIALEPGQCIRYRFRAKATHPFSITDIALIQANHPWASYGVSCRRATDITTDWQEHEVVIRTTLATPVTDGRLSFFIGSSIAEGSEFCFMPLGAELVSCDSLGLDADVGNIIFVPFDPGAANDTRVTNGSPAFAGSLARTNGRSNRATINKAELQKIAGWKRWDRASLTRQGDFYHDPDDNRLYLYSERHPAELYSQIEAAMKRVIVRFQDSTHVTVDGLTIAYTGAHGANGSYCKHGTIRNCEFLWIGGSHLFTQNGSPVRYGNGVEFWDGCEGMTVENNYFENIYDTAMTNQGRGEGEVKDMVWRDNKTFRCEQAYEIWFSNPEMKVDRLFVTGNECVDSGYGWGHVQRPNKNGCHFLAYTLKCKIGDIRYERNTLNNARDAIIWFTNSRLSEFCIDNNTYIQGGKAPDKKKLFRWLGAPAEGVTFDAYRDATGNDQESVLRASDPLNK